MISAISSSNQIYISNLFRENMVDYANEVECFYMFKYFDKNNDGYLDYDEYDCIINALVSCK